jgi:uncharacterized protein
VAAGFEELGALGEHAVKLVHEEVDGLVALVGGDGGVHVGTVDDDVALGGEAVVDVLLRVALEFNAEADDALFVAEEAFRLVAHELFQRRGEIEVDAGYDDVVGAIHDFCGIWVYLGQKGCEACAIIPMRALREMLSEYSVIVVTGGSSGIGKAFIEHAWKLNPEVVICNLSRRTPSIFWHQLNARQVSVNLADAGALGAAADEVSNYLREAAPMGKVMLINNSGFGGYGRVDELGREHQLEMIDVNVRAVVDITARLLPVLRERGGAVVNIASTAAFQPTAHMATYGATKAFFLHWSLALNEELRGSGVRALAVCPGPTATEFFKRAGLKQGAVSDRWGQTADDVALEAFGALARGRAQVVCGWGNWALSALAARLPKPLAARIGAAVLVKFRASKVVAEGSAK